MAKGNVMITDGRSPFTKYVHAGKLPVTIVATTVSTRQTIKQPINTYTRKEKKFSPKKIFDKAPDTYPKIQNIKGYIIMPPGRGSIAAHSATIPAIKPHTPPSFLPKTYPEASTNTRHRDGRAEETKIKGIRENTVVSNAASTQVARSAMKKSLMIL